MIPLNRRLAYLGYAIVNGTAYHCSCFEARYYITGKGGVGYRLMSIPKNHMAKSAWQYTSVYNITKAGS